MPLAPPYGGSQVDSRLSTIPTDRMKPGVILRQPIYAEDGVLLLAAGVAINKSAIDRLIQRGITSVRIHRSELDHVSGKGPKRPPTTATPTPLDTAPFLDRSPVQGTVAYDARLQGRVTTSRLVAVSEVAGVFKGCDIVRTGDAEVLEDLTTTSLAQLSEDSDLFLSQEALAQGTEYPAKQAVQSSSVAVAIGAKLGLNKRDLTHLGVGCMIHDLGMLHINVDKFRSDDPNDTSVRLEVMKHPAITFDLMNDVARRAGPARIVAYQIHERLDGSGFPRCREGNQIHPLAKIAAVADTYARLLSASSASQLSAYDAVVKLLHGTRQGHFDPKAVRGLLKAVSLFPIGTRVLLNDGRIGRVIRANGEAYTRPVVEAWFPHVADASREMVDLLIRRDLQVLRVVSDVEFGG